MFVVPLYGTASESQWNIGQLETLTQEMGEEIERLQQTHPYVHSDDEDEGSVDPYSKYHHPPGTEVSSLSLFMMQQNTNLVYFSERDLIVGHFDISSRDLTEIHMGYP